MRCPIYITEEEAAEINDIERYGCGMTYLLAHVALQTVIHELCSALLHSYHLFDILLVVCHQLPVLLFKHN